MEAATTREIISAGAIEVRPDEYVALAAGTPLRLTVRELQLLEAFVRRQGRIVGRRELYAVVWGERWRHDERSVDVYVRKLRVKLELALPEWQFIHTHFGFGYRFEPNRRQLS